MRHAYVYLALLAPAACAAPASEPTPIGIPALDPDLARLCARPTPIPDRDLTPAEVNSILTHDRAELADCADRHRLSVSFYERIRRALGGEQ